VREEQTDPQAIEIRLVERHTADLMSRVLPDVFDEPIDPRWLREFLDDPRHHLVVALDDGWVVGMATAVHYVHPDKAPQLWINEVGVAESHRRRGIGRRLVEVLLRRGQSLGCTEAWLGTEHDNVPARALYESLRGEAESFVLYSFKLTDRDTDESDAG